MKTTLLMTAFAACLGLAACCDYPDDGTYHHHHYSHDSSYDGQDMNDMTNPSDNNVTTTR